MTSCDMTGAAAKPCQASPEELCARCLTLRSSITKSRRLAVRRFPSDSLNGCQPYLQRAAEGVGLSRRPSYLTTRVASSPHPHGRLRANPAGLVYKSLVGGEPMQSNQASLVRRELTTGAVLRFQPTTSDGPSSNKPLKRFSNSCFLFATAWMANTIGMTVTREPKRGLGQRLPL